MRAESSIESYAHPLRPLQCHHLRRQNVGKFAGAAAEGQRTDASDRTGMTVRHCMRRARQHNPEFGRHHMRNALFGVVDIEQADIVVAAAFPHCLDEGGVRRIGIVVAARLGGDSVVLHRKG